MPELPEVEALAAFLREEAVGRVVARIDVVSLAALKTYDPPPQALHGLAISGVARHGKFLDVEVGGEAPGDPAALHLLTHLARAGWLHWRDALPPAPPRPSSKNPVAVRVHLAPADGSEVTSGFDLTEAGTRKGLAVYLTRAPAEVPGVARLGPDALTVSVEGLGALLAAAGKAQLKGVITDQSALAGIGNAYSDEILWTARLSPFKPAANLTADETAHLHEAMAHVLRQALERAVGQRAATLKAEKRAALHVHGRTGLPCPRCGEDVREVSFADKSLQYCTCQTGGQVLADRRMSKLLK